MAEETIFANALKETDPTQRRAYLDQACAGNASLRREVEALLHAHEKAGGILDRPAVKQLEAGPATHRTAPEDQTIPPHVPGKAPGRIEAKSSAGQGEDLSFLAPPAKSGHLGRLGHYEILKVIGRGGFGAVLQAFDEKLQRVVAIKVLSPQLAASATARRRFTREARAAAAVTHENVVTIHAVEDEHNPPYLVMQCIDGPSLQEKIDRQGPLSVKEVLRIGMQTARGLAAAHKQGLVHRDVKPANILLENGVERVKITDFGLARAVDDASLTQSGTIAGTPLYMAPEQAAGDALDHRADLFSLGSVLYVMCTGRPPFRAPNTVAVLMRVIEEVPRPIREINTEVPEWLCNVIRRLHAKKPGDRFQTARDVANLLGKYLAELQLHGRVTSARPARAAEVNANKPPSGRQPTATRQGLEGNGPRAASGQGRRHIIAGLAAIGLLLAGLLTIFWPRGDQEAGPGDTKGSDYGNGPPPAVAPFDGEQARAHQAAWARHLGVPMDLENSIGMKLRLLPPGSFLMGSPDAPERPADEGPEHEVVLTQPFYMGIHAVTIRQFKAFVNETEYRTEAEKNGGAWRRFPDGNVKPDPDPKTNWTNPGFEQNDDHPVTCVSWNDARAFCDWLSVKEKTLYTLPTEAQWEYACRAGSRTKFFFGNTDEDHGKYAWFAGNSDHKTHPVGLKRPNAWSLFDMQGNVWQWVADGYAENYYQRSPRQDPAGAGNADWRVYRGASHNEWPCRLAYRHGNQPPSVCSASCGFRVVLAGDVKAAAAQTQQNLRTMR
jgi:formylglycine-generating enzyme required for sulfatase activity/serine/threonine protein kinase